MRATCIVHLILFRFIMLPIFGDECINHGLLNVSTPLQYIIISSLNAMDQFSNPYKKTGEITGPYILIILNTHKRRNEV